MPFTYGDDLSDADQTRGHLSQEGDDLAEDQVRTLLDVPRNQRLRLLALHATRQGQLSGCKWPEQLV